MDIYHDRRLHRCVAYLLPPLHVVSSPSVGFVLLGHAYMVLLVLLCQTLVYREVTALFSLKTAIPKSDDVKLKGKDPWSKTLNWYFFAVTNYFLYGESIIYYFKVCLYPSCRVQSIDAYPLACC